MQQGRKHSREGNRENFFRKVFFDWAPIAPANLLFPITDKPVTERQHQERSNKNFRIPTGESLESEIINAILTDNERWTNRLE